MDVNNPLKIVLIGIDPYTYIYIHFKTATEKINVPSQGVSVIVCVFHPLGCKICKMGCTGELILPNCQGSNYSNQCHCHANQFRANQFRANQFHVSQCLASQCPAECSPSCQDLPIEPQRLDVYAPKVSIQTSKRKEK